MLPSLFLFDPVTSTAVIPAKAGTHWDGAVPSGFGPSSALGSRVHGKDTVGVEGTF